jgi:hypothetical protein
MAVINNTTIEIVFFIWTVISWAQFFILLASIDTVYRVSHQKYLAKCRHNVVAEAGAFFVNNP